jgi:hypothetical protein
MSPATSRAPRHKGGVLSPSSLWIVLGAAATARGSFATARGLAAAGLAATGLAAAAGLAATLLLAALVAAVIATAARGGFATAGGSGSSASGGSSSAARGRIAAARFAALRFAATIEQVVAAFRPAAADRFTTSRRGIAATAAAQEGKGAGLLCASKNECAGHQDRRQHDPTLHGEGSSNP